MAENRFKPCSVCGGKMVYRQFEYTKNGKKFVERHFMHEDKDAKCILNHKLFDIIADDVVDYVVDPDKLWNGGRCAK